MKYPRLVLSLSLVAFIATLSIASAHSDEAVTLAITKGGARTAKITMETKTYSAPISFGQGASWDSLKDGYNVPASYDELIEQGKVAISVEADGGISFRVINSGSKAASKPAKKK
jgi:hypothetical protein